MIIQLWVAIFERIQNVQIQALQTVFICLLSLSFLYVFHLWFKRYRRNIVYNDVKRDSVMCSLTLRQVHENRYVNFFGWNIFHLLSYEQNLLTNRIAEKQMNIKKIKLFQCGTDKTVKQWAVTPEGEIQTEPVNTLLGKVRTCFESLNKKIKWLLLLPQLDFASAEWKLFRLRKGCLHVVFIYMYVPFALDIFLSFVWLQCKGSTCFGIHS